MILKIQHRHKPVLKVDYTFVKNGATMNNEEFKNDRNFIISALKQKHFYVLQYADDTIKNDKEIALMAIYSQREGDITYVSKKILQDVSFIIDAYKKFRPLNLLYTPIKKLHCNSVEKKSFLDYINFEMCTNLDLDNALHELIMYRYSLIRLEFGIDLTKDIIPLMVNDAFKNIRINIFKAKNIEIPKTHCCTNDLMPPNGYKIVINKVVVFEETLDASQSNSSRIIQTAYNALNNNTDTIKKYQDALVAMRWDIL